MTKKQALQSFEQRKVRTLLDGETEKRYFSIVDVINVLTDSPEPNNYWKVLKNRFKKEGNETVTNCNRFKLWAADNITNLEIALNILAEASAAKLSKQRNPHGCNQQTKMAKDGDSVEKAARNQLESQLRSIIFQSKTSDYPQPKELEDNDKS